MAEISGLQIDRGSIQTVINGLETYTGRLYEALLIVTDVVAKKMESYAKSNAIWEDQSGNARQGIRGDAYWESSKILVCSLSHTMEYGVWLELAHQRKYAILEESINQYQAELIAGWQVLVGD